MLIRFPLELPAVAKPKRYPFWRHVLGVLGVAIGLMFVIFFFGLLAAFNQ